MLIIEEISRFKKSLNSLLLAVNQLMNQHDLFLTYVDSLS